MRIVLTLEKRGGDVIVGGHHSSQPAIEIGNDHRIAFTGQAGAEIFHLSGEPPPIMQEDDARIGPRLLRPEKETIDLVFFWYLALEVGVHHLVGVCGDWDTAWEAGCSRPDLCKCERCRLYRGHGRDALPERF